MLADQLSSARLPTFFVIGASKAGTTSLHHYLAAHPQIAMTEPKEPHVLCGPPDYRDRLFLYAQLLATTAPVRGEVSPGYSVVPFEADVPRRIAETVPDARLVYLVRDPIERAVAHYAEHAIQRWEHRTAEEALAPDGANSVYLAASRYATQVEAYLGHFDANRLLVIDSVALRDRRREALRRIFAHVGADPGFWDSSLEVEHYSRDDRNTRRTKAELALRGNPVYRRALRPLTPPRLRGALRRRARRALGRRIDPELAPELRSRLAEELRPEAERLRALTGERFESWSV